jgi:hypothetical protein
LDVASAPAFGKSSFLPQAAAVLVAGVSLSFDVSFALFIQTLAFVALNKVYVFLSRTLMLVMSEAQFVALQLYCAVFRMVFLFSPSSPCAFAPPRQSASSWPNSVSCFCQ